MGNSKALELADITRAARDPVGGRIFRDANGAATGVLEETAIDLAMLKIPPKAFEDMVAQNIAVQRIYNRSRSRSTSISKWRNAVSP